MHGIIFSELKRFVDEKLGVDAWPRLLRESGVATPAYLPVQAYPDQEVVALVSTASRLTNTPVPALLHAFGEFIVPTLVRMYGHLLKPQWKTLDVIERTEETIHSVVRAREPGAKPPMLSCARPKPDEVVVTYTSHRKLCPLLKGIVGGLARHFRERVAVDERACMLASAPACRIAVTRVG
jgi:hypothetical protein